MLWSFNRSALVMNNYAVADAGERDEHEVNYIAPTLSDS